MRSFQLSQPNITFLRLKHPSLKEPEQIKKGFSWPCLFFGSFWYFYKGMVGWGFATLLIAILSAGLSWLVFPFFANKQYVNYLVSKGYKQVG